MIRSRTNRSPLDKVTVYAVHLILVVEQGIHIIEVMNLDDSPRQAMSRLSPRRCASWALPITDLAPSP